MLETLRMGLGTVVLASIVGCGPVNSEIMVDSDLRPGVTITCAGQPMSGEMCRQWGDDILAGPLPPQGVTEVTLTLRGGDSRCSADFAGAGRRIEATAAIPCP